MYVLVTHYKTSYLGKGRSFKQNLPSFLFYISLKVLNNFMLPLLVIMYLERQWCLGTV